MSKVLPRDPECGTDEAEEASLALFARLCIWVEREELPSTMHILKQLGSG